MIKKNVTRIIIERKERNKAEDFIRKALNIDTKLEIMSMVLWEQKSAKNTILGAVYLRDKITYDASCGYLVIELDKKEFYDYIGVKNEK